MSTEASDRRRHARHASELRCKVLHRSSLRYMPARTSNLSDSGALLSVIDPRPLRPGDEIELGVAWDGAPVIDSGTLIRATVVRVLRSTSGEQAVGVAFAHELTIAIGAAA